MRRFALSVLLILLGFCGYSQKIIEDTSVKATVDVPSGIVYFDSDKKIDSVQIRGILDEIVFQEKVTGDFVNISSIPRSCYYIVFITDKREKLVQKLFFM